MQCNYTIAKKNGPGNPGPVVGRNVKFGTRRDCCRARSLTYQSPKRGRSPLRAAMRALAISARSTAAIKRAKKPVDVARPREAVFDMV